MPQNPPEVPTPKQIRGPHQTFTERTGENSYGNEFSVIPLPNENADLFMDFSVLGVFEPRYHREAVSDALMKGMSPGTVDGDDVGYSIGASRGFENIIVDMLHSL